MSPPQDSSGQAIATLVGKRITLCVTGSVAAYKAPILARRLMALGASVQVVMSRTAERFVGRATLAGLTHHRVVVSAFDGPGELHVEIAEASDLVVVAPATADLIARAAGGQAGDLITALLCCARCPVVLAPAMHPAMWQNPLVQDAVRRLRELSHWVVAGPAHGEVASGSVGPGRLLEPEQIASVIQDLLGEGSPAAIRLAGCRVVVTAGPTVEDLDPVRCLTNRSSGKMGFAIAAALERRGAEVTLVAGPVSLSAPPGVRRVDVRSALDMRDALGTALAEGARGADALVMCAAVSDYRPRQRSLEKLKRRSAEMTLELVQNPDLLAEIGRARPGPRPFLLGFAVETARGDELVAAARRKLRGKGCDAIVANAAADALGGDETRAMLVTETRVTDLGAGSKSHVAAGIADFLAERLRGPG